MIMRFKIDSMGTKQWYNDKGKLHRLDGPALIYDDGIEEWYINGKEVEPFEPIPNIIIKLSKKLGKKVPIPKHVLYDYDEEIFEEDGFEEDDWDYEEDEEDEEE